MIKPMLVFVTLAALAGCDDGAKPPAKEPPSAAATTAFGEAVVAAREIKLPDGTSLSLSGSILKQTSKPNDTGKVSLTEVAFDTASRKVEEDVYAKLQKSGYTRKVIEERGGFMKVHYYKANFPVVGGVYQDKNANGQEKSQFTLYWQES